jgi:diacylglycerol kinase (ATP)
MHSVTLHTRVRPSSDPGSNSPLGSARAPNEGSGFAFRDLFRALFGRGRIQRNRCGEPGEVRLIGQIQTERRDRDVAALHCPQIRAGLGLFDRDNGEPEVLAAHRILARNDATVVVTDCLTRPGHAAGRCRKVDIEQSGRRVGQQNAKNALDMRFERVEVRLLSARRSRRRAQRDPANAKQGGLLCRGQRAGVPDPVAKVDPGIDSRQDHIDPFPVVYSQCDAVGRCAVDAPRLGAGGDLGAPVGQWPRRGDRMAGRRLFDIGCNDAHVAEAGSDAGERGDARTVYAVIIGDQDAHGRSSFGGFARPMKITLIHNASAGRGQETEDLVRLITNAGHEVRHGSAEEGWQRLLKAPADLVVAAGGDGTVRRVALAAADHGLPFAAIPIGTANNIAKTLGVLGDARDLVGTWSASPRSERPFDMGEVAGSLRRERFVEGVGGGVVADLVGRGEEVLANATLLGRETDRALHLFGEIVREAPVRHWRVLADSTDLSGDYIAVEVLNIRLVGPNLPFAPQADPSDGLLDLVLVGVADRDSLLAYAGDRLSLASGRLPALRSIKARAVEVVAPAGVRLHVDDRNWPSARPLSEAMPLSIRCLGGAATFVGTAGKT